jgi:hypothetical protein
VNERLALVLKQQLAAVGVDMSVEEAPMDRVFEAMKSGRFEATLIEGISGPTLLRPYQLWHSNGTVNPGALGNVTVDAAFDRVRHAASTPNTQAVAGSSRRSWTIRPAFSSPGRCAPAPSANASASRRPNRAVISLLPFHSGGW